MNCIDLLNQIQIKLALFNEKNEKKSGKSGEKRSIFCCTPPMVQFYFFQNDKSKWVNWMGEGGVPQLVLSDYISLK